jgi:hypothetical protein
MMRQCRLILSGLSLSLLLGACATRAPRPEPAATTPTLTELQARQLVHTWQQQLADYLARTGDGDPAALAQLPTQRATGTLRPARISFGVLDLDARVAEADGFDVQGLLLVTPSAQGYVFMVGIVQRGGYRPQALVDLRPVTMQLNGGQLSWTVGDSDTQALARYRAAIDPTVPLRFPADKDHFELVPCAPGLCVAEQLTQARWTVAP